MHGLPPTVVVAQKLNVKTRVVHGTDGFPARTGRVVWA
jgi:hypothetical protein